ncbi:MAG: FHA domain-containing protein [Clostridiales bacterium]|nr:FHA domain-containing protein [Clostridiales bacterium]
MEAKYYKDYKHNYMILQCRQEEINGNYQYKILESGKIRELLKCSIRHINGLTYFYYDISSKITLENYYQSKKMSYEQVQDLLRQIHYIYDRLGAFFMEEVKLVLLPECIYYDLTERKYMGLYYPDYHLETGNVYEMLMDFLLDHIDTEDKQLADCIYRIYEMSEEACFTMEEALRLLEQCGGKEKGAEAETNFPYMSEVSEKDESEKPLYAYEEERPFLPNPSTSAGRKSLFFPVFAILSAGGMAAAVMVYYFYELSAEETLLLTGCGAVMGICLLICIAAMIRDYRKGNSGSKLAQGSLQDKEGEELYEEVKNPIPLDQVLSKDMNLYITGQSKTDREPAGEETEYGNTVFFDPSGMAEYKLYALDGKNKKHIELKQFPCTIGKMAGCVDYVLADDSISRIHAKFDRSNDRIWLTDMNSTNGTYKNGLRMQPQETTEIEPGDEIRFGNLNYCYR